MASQTVAINGPLVAIGGAENKTSQSEILRRVLELSPAANLEVGVITSASNIPDEVYPAYEQVFAELGAAVVHNIDVRTRDDATEERHIEVVRRCDVIFMSGGDQLRLTHILGGSPLLNAMRERLAEGAVIAGTSAGAAVIFHDGPVIEALGSGHVIVIDSSDLKSSNVANISEGEPVAVEHVVMHALTSGFGYDVNSRRFLQPEEIGRADKDAENENT